MPKFCVYVKSTREVILKSLPIPNAKSQLCGTDEHTQARLSKFQTAPHSRRVVSFLELCLTVLPRQASDSRAQCVVRANSTAVPTFRVKGHVGAHDRL